MVAEAETVSDLVNWVSALGTLGALAVALALGLGLAEWLRRPKLNLEFSLDHSSDRVVTATMGGWPMAFVRARVANSGRSSAKNVSVSLLSVEDWLDTHRAWVRRKPELDGRALAWSNVAHTEPVDIPPGVERLLDLVAMPRDWNNQGQIPMTIQIKQPGPASHAERLPPGKWRLRLEIAAENVAAKEVEIAISFSGIWPADPPERIWEAVAVAGPGPRNSIAGPPQPQMLPAEEQLERALEADRRDAGEDDQ